MRLSHKLSGIMTHGLIAGTAILSGITKHGTADGGAAVLNGTAIHGMIDGGTTTHGTMEGGTSAGQTTPSSLARLTLPANPACLPST